MGSQKEIWRDVKKYEGKYQISSFGRVRSLPRKSWNGYTYWEQPGRILKLSMLKNGYKSVCLYRDNKPKKFLVHRLVAEAFISNPNNYPQVNHKDENRSNNKMENLEWCTAMYNAHYGNHMRKLTAARRTSKQRNIARKNGRKASKKVLQLTMSGKVVQEWSSMSEAARFGNFRVAGISDCCRGKTKYHAGYKWKYAS